MLNNICLLVLAVSVTTIESCDPRSCPTIPKHYEELGCKPIKKSGECCASRFDCPDLFDHDNSKCYFKNQTLLPGEVLENFSHSDTCQSKCYCNLHRGGGPSEIVCNFQRCVEKLPHGQKVGRCLKQYDHEHCCPIKSVCDDDINKLATCDFEGRTYREGERMFPRQKCYKCFCSKNFDAKVALADNKNCFKIDCGIALTKTVRLSEGCIPVYIKTDDCCPVGWRCPGDKHMTGHDATGNANNKCRFGNMMLNVGESLDLGGDNCQDCTCRLPPMLHCIQNC